MRVKIYPSTPTGAILVPPSKSVAHRAIIMASLAGGISAIENVVLSEDMQATMKAMRMLGAFIIGVGNWCTIHGITEWHMGGNVALDCAESGSTLRFLIPIAAAIKDETTFTGRGRLLDRPQTVYSEIFEKCGVNFSHESDKIVIDGKIKAGEFVVQGNISSQFITGLLLVLPLLDGDSTIKIIPPFESRSYVNITLQTMQDFGVNASFIDEHTLSIAGGQKYKPTSYTVEGDYSQMAFFAVMGAIKGDITALNMRDESLQGDKVITEIIAKFAGVQPEGNRFKSSPLKGQDIDIADCPDLGPILMVLASFAEGTTTIYNAGRLRLKESDRIAAMESELTKLGVAISSTDDTVTISGRCEISGNITVDAHNDHRIAMSLAVFAACSNAIVTIDGAECVNKSYPNFYEDLEKVWVEFKLID